MTRREIKDFLEEIEKMRNEIDDQTASKYPKLYPFLNNSNKIIPEGKRINWNGAIYRAAADIIDNQENNPENNSNLWIENNYRDGYRVIKSSSSIMDSFELDELGWWNGKVYKSLLNANTDSPDDYAPGWEIVEI